MLLTIGVYERGRHYVYRYEGHVISGVPRMSNQFGGLKIDCDVALQFPTHSDVVAKVQTVLKLRIWAIVRILLITQDIWVPETITV